MGSTDTGSGRGSAEAGARRPGSIRGLTRMALIGAALSGALVASASVAAASPKHHATKAKGPCLVGNWTATNFTLNESGQSASGGAGTQVDISANQNVVGKFTPGAALQAAAGGTFKFSGTDIGKYGFSTKSSAKTGTFPVTYSSASAMTLSVNGGPARAVPLVPTTGSYTCAGKGLTLAFPAGGNQITYTLVPSK
jgi:hypothetical protein